MNASDYRKAKQRALNYGLLLFTKRQLEASHETLLAQKIGDIIQHNKLPFPEGHEAQSEIYAGFYNIDLNRVDIERIVSVLFNKEADVSQTMESPAFYTSAVDAWYELIS
jgi:hypothetical protein